MGEHLEPTGRVVTHSSSSVTSVYSEHNPWNLEQDKVEVLLLEEVLVLPAEVLAGTARLGFCPVRVCALSEVCKLLLQGRQCPFGRLGLGLDESS